MTVGQRGKALLRKEYGLLSAKEASALQPMVANAVQRIDRLPRLLRGREGQHGRGVDTVVRVEHREVRGVYAQRLQLWEQPAARQAWGEVA